ncbi:MAG TPA: dienelactone hydrolase family protein [Anaerolineales bacterium]|nr:dienelactone hydrolase family protein [Anaerolineales bacterium]
MNTTHKSQPHQNAMLIATGRPVSEAQAAMLMLHGRGASAEDILSLSQMLELPGFAYIAPQAYGYTWYPYRFLAPLEANQPFLSSGLTLIATILADLEGQGLPPERVILLGFSQGACLALEYAARHARRYGGVAGLSGGLIGPPGTSWDYPGSLEGTPVFLGCSDSDAHIPKERVLETAQILDLRGATVTSRLYPGMGHTINQEEIDHLQAMGSALLQIQ